MEIKHMHVQTLVARKFVDEGEASRCVSSVVVEQITDWLVAM